MVGALRLSASFERGWGDDVGRWVAQERYDIARRAFPSFMTVIAKPRREDEKRSVNGPAGS